MISFEIILISLLFGIPLFILMLVCSNWMQEKEKKIFGEENFISNSELKLLKLKLSFEERKRHDDFERGFIAGQIFMINYIMKYNKESIITEKTE